MTDSTQPDRNEQGAVEAPFGYKADGTPRKRPPPRRKVKSHNVLQQRAPEFDDRPVNVRTTRRRRGRTDGLARRLPHYDLPPEYVGRWVLDRDGGGRIQHMYNNDWDFVVPGKDGLQIRNEDLGSNLSVVANRTVGGEKQYLMAKPREMYEEDRQMKQRRNDEIDAALDPRNRENALAMSGDPNFYDRSDVRRNEDAGLVYQRKN